MIYFMRVDEDGPVKIGWSTNIVKRLYQVRPTRLTELTIIRLIDRERWVERWFHRQFDDSRLNGEWFTFDPEMLTVDAPAEEPIYNGTRGPWGKTRQITIRLPSERVEALKAGARAEHRSLARQVEHLLSLTDARPKAADLSDFEVNHIDNDPHNTDLDNLELVPGPPKP